MPPPASLAAAGWGGGGREVLGSVGWVPLRWVQVGSRRGAEPCRRDREHGLLASNPKSWLSQLPEGLGR